MASLLVRLVVCVPAAECKTLWEALEEKSAAEEEVEDTNAGGKASAPATRADKLKIKSLEKKNNEEAAKVCT